MESDVPTQQPIPSAPVNTGDSAKMRPGFFKRHPVVTSILSLVIAILFGLWLCFRVILNIGISKTSDTRYSITLRNNTYEAILSEPQYVFPYFSIAQNEFGNKIVLIRNDVPRPTQDFLMARGAYYFYFGSFKNEIIRQVLADIAGLVRYPAGFGQVVVAKVTGDEYGYSLAKRDVDRERTLANSQSDLTDVNVVGQIVEYMSDAKAFHVFYLIPGTTDPVMEGGKFQQAYVYLENQLGPNGQDAKLFDDKGNPVTISYFDEQDIAGGQFIITISGKEKTLEPGWMAVFAREIHQIPRDALQTKN
jgi:hypothetical protein